ncbi:MAG: hypothetical protein AAF645_04775 [Myxococcota bacterium]
MRRISRTLIHRLVLLALGSAACDGADMLTAPVDVGMDRNDGGTTATEDSALPSFDEGVRADMGSGDAEPAELGASDAGATDAPSVEARTLSERYPNDRWDRADPAIIFATNFEDGAEGLSLGSYTDDRAEILRDAAEAYEGSGAMKLSFTLSGIAARGTASASATTRFPLPVGGEYFVRFYMRYGEGTARPHHGNGTRVYAEGFDRGGTAGLRPAGDERFNTRIDLDGQDRQFFYTYWHEMRSGRCNDGSATPGCAGDQGNTYYYGNHLKPPDQTFVDRFAWHCYEYALRVNTPNASDGAIFLWTDDEHVGSFETGTPLGQWLRDKFYTMGEWSTTPTEPFEGLNFRTDARVNLVRVRFEIYQEQNTLQRRRDDTPDPAEEQAVFYDDIVIATERIGCRQ